MRDSPGLACELHPATPAAAACSACGRGACEVCLRWVNRAPLCEACAAGRAEQRPEVAAVFSALCPGLGQVYNGEIGKGIAFFLTGVLVLPWIWSLWDAARVAAKIQRGERRAATVPTGVVLLVLKVVAVVVPVLLIVVIVAIVAMLSVARG